MFPQVPQSAEDMLLGKQRSAIWRNRGGCTLHIDVCITYICIHISIYILYRVYEYVYVSNYETRMATAKHIARCEGKYTLDNDCLQTGCAGRIRMPSLYFNILQGSPSSRRSYS